MAVVRSSSGTLTIGRIAYRWEGGDYSASAQRGRSVICDCIVSLVDKRVDGRNRIYLTIALCKCGVVLSIFGEADFVSNAQKFNLGPSYFR